MDTNHHQDDVIDEPNDHQVQPPRQPPRDDDQGLLGVVDEPLDPGGLAGEDDDTLGMDQEEEEFLQGDSVDGRTGSSASTPRAGNRESQSVSFFSESTPASSPAVPAEDYPVASPLSNIDTSTFPSPSEFSAAMEQETDEIRLACFVCNTFHGIIGRHLLAFPNSQDLPRIGRLIKTAAEQEPPTLEHDRPHHQQSWVPLLNSIKRNLKHLMYVRNQIVHEDRHKMAHFRTSLRFYRKVANAVMESLHLTWMHMRSLKENRELRDRLGHGQEGSTDTGGGGGDDDDDDDDDDDNGMGGSNPSRSVSTASSLTSPSRGFGHPTASARNDTPSSQGSKNRKRKRKAKRKPPPSSLSDSSLSDSSLPDSSPQDSMPPPPAKKPKSGRGTFAVRCGRFHGQARGGGRDGGRCGGWFRGGRGRGWGRGGRGGGGGPVY